MWKKQRGMKTLYIPDPDAMDYRQGVNTGLRSNRTTPAASRMRQGLQTTTGYKAKPSRELPSDTSLPDELNYFYARLKASNTEACMRAQAVLDDCVITLAVANVRPLNRSAFTRPQGHTDYQNVYSKHALTNWQVSSLTFSTCPWLSL